MNTASARTAVDTSGRRPGVTCGDARLALAGWPHAPESALSGVERVDTVCGCTVTEDTAYFSHRRDVTLRGLGVTGRQMSVIARATPPLLDDDMFR